LNCNARRDKLLSQHIEVALVYKDMLGLDEAIAYLQRESVPSDIAQRVLMTGRRRRQPAAAAAAPVPPPYAGCRRRNHVHDAIVEAALKIERKLGVDWALNLLRDEQVSKEVVTRLSAQVPRQLRVKPRAG